jgi:hypothetical protein
MELTKLNPWIRVLLQIHPIAQPTNNFPVFHIIHFCLYFENTVLVNEAKQAGIRPTALHNKERCFVRGTCNATTGENVIS